MCVIAKIMKIGLLSIKIHSWEDDFKTIVGEKWNGLR
jgi:hypothetical protein